MLYEVITEDELLAAKANLRAAKSALFPSLNITGTVGYEAFRPNLITSPQSMALNALGGLIAPVINRSALKSAFMTANSMQLQALYNYEKSIINGFTEVRNNISGLNYSNEALSLKTKESYNFV